MKKYIRFDAYNNKFYYCLVDTLEPKHNKEYGVIKEEHIPPEIATEAKARAGIYPCWVEITHAPQSDR